MKRMTWRMMRRMMRRMTWRMKMIRGQRGQRGQRGEDGDKEQIAQTQTRLQGIKIIFNQISQALIIRQPRVYPYLEVLLVTIEYYFYTSQQERVQKMSLLFDSRKCFLLITFSIFIYIFNMKKNRHVVNTKLY